MTTQSILTIDAATKPAHFQLVEVDGQNLKVLESYSCDLRGIFDAETLARVRTHAELRKDAGNGDAATTKTSESETAANDSGATNPSAAGSSGFGAAQENGNGASSSENSHFQSGSTAQTLEECASTLQECLSKIKGTYTSAILIIPTADYLSLNLDLPFADPKQINKILDLEVQDRVPFEISEFLVEHRAIAPLQVPTSNSASPTNSLHDVHVSIIPKSLLSSVLRICKTAKFEPLVITTVASILEGLFILGPNYFKPNAAVILQRDSSLFVVLRFDERVRVDRIINLSKLPQNPDAQMRALCTELRLTFMAAESRYGRPIEQVYVLGEYPNPRELQPLLGRDIESVALSEIIPSHGSPVGLASLGAPFAQDVAPPPILTNFRTREFSYSLQLSEVFSGLRRLFPMFCLAALTLMIALTGFYYFRESEIASLQSAMRERITQLIPALDPVEGDEVNSIQAENAKLDKALEGLGSGSLNKYTALDLLKELSVIMPAQPGLIIRSVTIRGNRIRLQGTAPKYGTVSDIENALKRSKSVKFRAKPPEITSASGGGPGGSSSAQNFSFDIRVEE